MSKKKIPLDDVLKKLYLEEKLSSGVIATKFGCTRNTVCRHLRRLGIIRPISGVNSRNRNFGKRQFKHGYPMTFLPNHPRANNIGYVFDHILIIEKVTGKTPIKGEPIHHIDGNRKNSSFSNLYICKSHKEHQLVHSSLDDVAKELLERGIIKFENGRYFII
jgi:hypothetical protein